MIAQTLILFGLLLLLLFFQGPIDKIRSNTLHSLLICLSKIIIFLILIKICLLNYLNIPLLIYTVGFFLNALVIVLNKGYMPVDPVAFQEATLLPASVALVELNRLMSTGRKHISISNKTKLNFLGDILPYRDAAYSIGDLLINLGFNFIIIQLPILFFIEYFKIIT